MLAILNGMRVSISPRLLTASLAYLGLLWLTWLLVRPFWQGLVWSFILAIVTWPFYRHIKTLCRGKPHVSAAVMTVILLVGVTLPLTLVIRALAAEAVPAAQTLLHWLLALPPLPEWLKRLPLVGDLIQEALAAVRGGLKLEGEWFLPLVRPGTKAIALLGEGILQSLLMVFVLFFVYRSGDSYRRQIKAVGAYLFGDQVDRLLDPTKEALRAVFAGILLAAIAQGAVAAVGFAIVDLPGAVLLGVATAIFAVLPAGAVLVWGTATAGLALTGMWVKALILLLWGMLAVSTVDNLVRPLVISRSVQLPYLQTFLAVLGGLATMGLMGLFVGPAILAIWLVIWREWVAGGEKRLEEKVDRLVEPVQ